MRRIAITLSFMALLGVPLGAQVQTAFPSLEPDSRAEVYALRGAGGYSWEDFAEIGLWASEGGQAASAAYAGTGPAGSAEGEALMDDLREAVQELRNSPELSPDPRERGEYLLGWMHRRFLKTYSLQQTRLDTLLTGGRYNCVSSAVLYLILGTAADLELRGVMTKDHAFIAVRAGDEWIDVETTNPYGFDPGNRKDFHDQFGRVTGFAYVPARNYRDRAVISPVELISLIFSNRIAELERQNRFAEAVPLAISRGRLLLGGEERRGGGAFPGGPEAGASGEGEPLPFFEDPRRDIMNRIFNFGASLLKGGKEDEALRWAALAGPRYPDEERWQEFIFAAANNRLIKQTRAGRLAEARESLSLLAPALRPANFDRLDAFLTDMELMERASKIKSPGEAEALITLINAAEDRQLMASPRAGELRTFAVEMAASILSAGRDWAGAVAWLEGALERYGPSPRIERNLRNARSNLATDYHNRFAAAWNGRNREEAEKILEEGLTLFPENRQLLADRATVEKIGK
jgi:tetratricopeptide (TPR) repeat protein